MLNTLAINIIKKRLGKIGGNVMDKPSLILDEIKRQNSFNQQIREYERLKKFEEDVKRTTKMLLLLFGLLIAIIGIIVVMINA